MKKFLTSFCLLFLGLSCKKPKISDVQTAAFIKVQVIHTNGDTVTSKIIYFQ